MNHQAFQKIIWGYYARHGRDLPWRRTRDPYKILISEVMLQQTQVSRVANYYTKFLKQFPTITALGTAPLADVLRAWQGLGYNRRALILKRLAERIAEEYGGKLPTDTKSLDDLPGIGVNTAGAIAAFAFNMPAVFIETNIRRVFIHFFFSGKSKVHDRDILRLVEHTLDRKNLREWYYALMDYGAYLGQKMQENPNRRSRHYTRQSRFEGSDRQIRAGIVRVFLKQKSVTLRQVLQNFDEPPERVRKILAALEKDGFIVKSGAYLKLT